MSGSITSVGTTHDTEMSGEFFGVQLSADHGKGSVLQFNGLDVYDGSSHMQVTPTGLTFPDSTVQTSAAFVPGSGNLDMEGYDITNANFNSSAGQVSAQNVSLSSGGSITFGDSTVQTTAYTGGGGYITSVTSPLAVTSGDLSIDLSGYATESFVTSQGYITQGTADGLYYSISNPQGFVDASYVNGQGFITQTTADGLYYGISNPSGFIAFDSYNRLKFTPLSSVPSSWTQGELYYSSNKFSYTTTGNQFNILATEAWVQGLGYATLASPTFSGDPKAPTPATGDNDTSIATTAFVKAQGYLTSAPVTSVAGRTGAITLAVADVSGAAPLASPSLTGTPLSTTAAADTNTTQIATTAFVVGQASSTAPVVDGTATVGTSLKYARADHVHPTDTSRAALASPSFTGTPLSTTAAVDTNTTQIATTAYVVGQASSTTPANNGTAAVGTSLKYARADHVHATDTTRAPLASPTFTGTVTIPAGASISGFAPLASPSLTGVPLSTTAAADTNTTQIATTAYVVGQASSTAPVVDGTATVGTSLKYARADHVHPTDTSRAALNSPAFTGTPSLPTGTTAVTQTAGNNTTAVATTAFVTAAVPAFATAADAVLQSSTTKALSPSVAPFTISNGLTTRLDYITATGVSGSGTVTAGIVGFREMYTSSTGTNGKATFTAGQTGLVSVFHNLTSEAQTNFSKKIWMSGRFMAYLNSTYVGDANGFVSISLGGYTTTTATGAMTARGIGLRKLGGAASVIQLVVHNGTTQTLVDSTKTMGTQEVVEYLVYSDGAGNVQLYLNGSLAASSSAGPTGNTADYQNIYREQAEQTSSATSRHLLHCYGGQLITER